MGTTPSSPSVSKVLAFLSPLGKIYPCAQCCMYMGVHVCVRYMYMGVHVHVNVVCYQKGREFVIMPQYNVTWLHILYMYSTYMYTHVHVHVHYLYNVHVLFYIIHCTYI